MSFSNSLRPLCVWLLLSSCGDLQRVSLGSDRDRMPTQEAKPLDAGEHAADSAVPDAASAEDAHDDESEQDDSEDDARS